MDDKQNYPDPVTPQYDKPPHESGPKLELGSILAMIAQLVWLATVIILILLAIRVVFSLIGANADNQFASFIYASTGPLVEPFRGLLQVGEYQVGVIRLEFETIIGMFVYLLAGWGIAALVKILKR